MPRLSRRQFVAGTLAAPALSAFPWPGHVANAQALKTRFNLASPNGQAMLRKYAQAVKIMKATPPGNPLSWNFQWFTHWVPGTSMSPTFKTNAINSTAFPAPANKALAQLMWDTCQAHGPGMVDFFLPWHRMYVCFFEAIIRKVLNDNTFTLPYWDYSVPAGRALPKEFRMSGDPIFGSLFEPKRRPVVNNGQPIFTGIGIASDLSPAGALAQANYSTVGVNPGFCLALDQGLHGNIHVFVGTSQNMGSVPNAAGDAIFWMHHCNIDRLWNSWNQAGHVNPGAAGFLSKSFVFAGQNGQQITAVVRDYVTTLKCGYRYDQLAPAPTVVAAAPATGRRAAEAAAAPPAPVTLATPASQGPVALGTAPVRVALQRSPEASSAAGEPPLGARLSALPVDRSIYLVIKNLSAATTPEAIYRVYLDLPEGTPDDPLNSHYVGSFNFFDAAGQEDHGGHATKPVSFEITTVLGNLQARGVLKPDHSVTVVPSGEPSTEARAVVGEISIVEQ